MSHHNGVAEEQGKDRTGAPGSQPVCTSCHNNGTFNVTSEFNLVSIDGSATDVVEYLPGTEYVLELSVESSGNPGGYGMQATAVLEDGSNAGSFSDPSSNVQLESVNGRHIFEHNNTSNSNQFTVTWTSPETWSGDVTFYASTLAVNDNGGNGGDSYDGVQLTIPEGPNSVGESIAQRWSVSGAAGGIQIDVPAETVAWIFTLSGRIVETTSVGAGGDFVGLSSKGWHIVQLEMPDATTLTKRVYIY